MSVETKPLEQLASTLREGQRVRFVEALTSVQKALQPVKVTVVASFRQMMDHLRAAHPAIMRLHLGDDWPRHRRSCSVCNPAGNPPPLRINGHEYQRRTRRRNRR